MTRLGLIRLGGLAAIVGGVFWVVGTLWRSPRLDEFVPVAFLALGGLAALAALHLLQRESYTRRLLGTLLFLLAFVGMSMIFVDALSTSVPGAQMVAPPFEFLLFGWLAGTVGLIGYGVQTISTGVLPWWCGAALIAGSPFFGYLLYFSALDWLLGVPWILVGYAIFRAAGQRTERPPRVR